MLTIAQLHEKAALMRQCPTLSEGRANDSFATMGLSFESQVVFGCYILDFVVLSRLLVVEVDGESHASKQAYDAQRDAFYAELGLQVLRIPNAWAHKSALLVEPFPEIPRADFRLVYMILTVVKPVFRVELGLSRPGMC